MFLSRGLQSYRLAGWKASAKGLKIRAFNTGLILKSGKEKLSAVGGATVDIKTPMVDVPGIDEGTIVGETSSTGIISFAVEQSDGQITKRLQLGDRVKEEDVVALIETRKITLQVRAPISGTVIKFLVPPFSEVKLPGQPILRLLL